MRYEPRTTKKRVRIKWALIFPIVCLVLASVYGVTSLFNRPKEDKDAFKVCEYTPKETTKLFLDKVYEEGEVQAVDFNYYGESLDLSSQEYAFRLENNEFSGKTVVLTNICNEEEYQYFLGPEVDKKIQVQDLTPGFYEVYMIDGLSRKRVYMDEPVEDDFYTVTRNGINNQVKLLANKSLIKDKDENPLMEKDYLFIQVKEEVLPEDVYDIIIDPGHGSYDEGSFPEKGHGANGLIEADETFKAATVLKEELENLGFKVKLGRPDEETMVNTYGTDGRVHQVYKNNVKYYLQLHLNSINYKSVRGMEVYHSSYSSNDFAKMVLNHVTESTGLKASGNVSNNNPIPSVIPCTRFNGYDGYMIIRETGGRALGAAEFSEKSRNENSSFVQGTNKGANTLLVEYLYMSNVEDVKLWKENYAKYAKATAESIAKYLNVEIGA